MQHTPSSLLDPSGSEEDGRVADVPGRGPPDESLAHIPLLPDGKAEAISDWEHWLLEGEEATELRSGGHSPLRRTSSGSGKLSLSESWVSAAKGSPSGESWNQVIEALRRLGWAQKSVSESASMGDGMPGDSGNEAVKRRRSLVVQPV
jgi:hypothetical protein